MSELTIAALNDSSEAAFVDALGDIYEHSPWVAERAAPERPFESVADLHERMVAVVENASRERKLELLQAHPDLGDRTEMTDESEKEQASAGLDRLSPEQYDTFQRLNDQYREQFGFPFIMAVKGADPDEIQAAMEQRVEHTEGEEFRTAIAEVHEIARLRLDERLASG